MSIEKKNSEVPENGVCLIAMINGKEGKVFPLEEGENLIGRWDPDAVAFPEVDLTEVDPDVKVSRKHATIDRHGTDLVLKDGGSRNGTFLMDGTQLKPGEAHKLSHDEHIVFAKVQLKVRIGG